MLVKELPEANQTRYRDQFYLNFLMTSLMLDEPSQINIPAIKPGQSPIPIIIKAVMKKPLL